MGRVREVLVEGAGHLVPLEKVGDVAGEIVGWLMVEMERWRKWEEGERREWGEVPRGGKAVLSERYLKALKGTLEDEVEVADGKAVGARRREKL